jgi:hypothetical protein
LFMLNSPFLFQQAAALATSQQLREAAPDEPAIQRLYRAVFSRDAAPEEVRAGLAFLQAQKWQPEAGDEPPVWTYGFGKYDEVARKLVSFHALPHWTGYAWQGGKELPDAKLGWVLINRDGGHPGTGAEHSAIRRWIAPRAGTFTVNGALTRPSKEGDGVIGYVVSSMRGELKRVTVDPGGSVEVHLENVPVQSGETIDFIVGARANETSDSFSWAPIIRGENREWDAQLAFAGPPPPKRERLSPWEKYAQVLLSTNEFAFVD